MRNEEENEFLRSQSLSLEIPVLGLIPHDLAVQEADRLGVAVYDYVPSARESAKKIATSLDDALL